ncbi:MAG: hypothetical protein ACLQNG_18735 [Acidimicrobiales bacterium]|jgi:hypothetical protein
MTPWPGRRLGFVLVAVIAGTASCSNTTPPPSSRTAPTPALSAPLNNTLTTPAGTWAVLPMGILSQPLNTFWELFFRSTGTSRWVLVTPPGVALNGGLTVAQATGGPLIVGIEPTNLLRYSPLAQRALAGGGWAPPGLVPGALAPTPDALASSVGSGLLAVLRGPNGAGDSVVRSSGSVLAWAALVTRQGIAASQGATSCQVGNVTSVAFSAAGADLVGTECRAAGIVGVFAESAAGWVLVGPHLGGSMTSQPASVLRLWGDGSAGLGASGLVALSRNTSRSLVAIWQEGSSGSWRLSSPLAVAADSRIVASGDPAGGELFVLIGSSGGALDLETVAPSGSWQEVSGLPAGTVDVSIGAGGVVDALTVATTIFTDWRRNATTGVWGKLQTMRVPVPLGSSS